jgi:hypothetical protein
MNILWQGSRGTPVLSLQSKLQEHGFDPGKADGVFGPQTHAALTAFQKEKGLFADGIAGPQTLLALKLATPTTRSAKKARTKVFVSYSHADAKWLKMLQIHLAPLERNGGVEHWDDTKITPGKDWRHEIDAALRAAKVAVLLVSAYFMASEFIGENELPALLKAAEHDGLVVLEVIISPCMMGDLAKFQAVNSPSKPLVDLGRGDRDRVWVKVLEAITLALNE